MTTDELKAIIKDNHDRVDRIFSAIDFGQVCMTAELITDMNDFYNDSKRAAE